MQKKLYSFIKKNNFHAFLEFQNFDHMIIYESFSFMLRIIPLNPINKVLNGVFIIFKSLTN